MVMSYIWTGVAVNCLPLSVHLITRLHFMFIYHVRVPNGRAAACPADKRGSNMRSFREVESHSTAHCTRNHALVGRFNPRQHTEPLRNKAGTRTRHQTYRVSIS